MKSYIYENSRIIAQRNGGQTAAKYFYVNDRLGSVRQLIDMSGNVERNYTYSPFGQVLEQGGSFDNPFMFTGQWFDDEISQYYLRARMYDPALMRFTSRDPVRGKFKNPLTLHVYLYCRNDPINAIDPDGRLALLFGGSFSGNISASDYGSLFCKKFAGIGAMVAYYSAILPAATKLTEYGGIGATGGAGFVVAWDHTKHFNDRNAWSWGTMQWLAGGGSFATGTGGSITVDVGISNAKHVSQLSGYFAEFGVSGIIPSLGGVTVGGTLSRGITAEGEWNDIWLGTVSAGGGTAGVEGHLFVGHAWVQEYEW